MQMDHGSHKSKGLTEKVKQSLNWLKYTLIEFLELHNILTVHRSMTPWLIYFLDGQIE